MASDTRIPKAEITGVYGTVLKRMSKKMVGEVPDALGVMWHNRPVLKASMGLGHKATKWRACDKGLKSYAHMAVASLIGCSFCLDLGYFQAHNEGLDEAKAREVPRWRESDVFTPRERDVMEYAEAMYRRRRPSPTSSPLGCSSNSERRRWSSSPRSSRWRTRWRVRTSLSASRPRGSRQRAAWRLWRSRGA